MRAPPKENLRSLPVLHGEAHGEEFWQIAVDEKNQAQALLAADYGVVALDIEGARRVLTPRSSICRAPVAFRCSAPRR